MARKRKAARKIVYRIGCFDRLGRGRDLYRATRSAAMVVYRKATKARWACVKPVRVIRRARRK